MNGQQGYGMSQGQYAQAGNYSERGPLEQLKARSIVLRQLIASHDACVAELRRVENAIQALEVQP